MPQKGASSVCQKANCIFVKKKRNAVRSASFVSALGIAGAQALAANWFSSSHPRSPTLAANGLRWCISEVRRLLQTVFVGAFQKFDRIRVRFAHPPSPPQGKACRRRAVSAAGEGDRSMPLFPLLVSRCSRCGRRRCTGEVPEPSPLQGKVAKAIFCENCFRRMRWNIGVLLRYTKRSPIHRGIPNIHRSANARLTSAKANPLPHMSHLHTSTSSGNRSFTRCISTLRPPMNIVKMVFQMKL